MTYIWWDSEYLRVIHIGNCLDRADAVAHLRARGVGDHHLMPDRLLVIDGHAGEIAQEIHQFIHQRYGKESSSEN